MQEHDVNSEERTQVVPNNCPICTSTKLKNLNKDIYITGVCDISLWGCEKCFHDFWI